MTAAVRIVKQALNRIGAHSELLDADPELQNAALDVLVDMLYSYERDNVLMAVDVDGEPTKITAMPAVLGDEIGEVSGLASDLSCSLAIRIAAIARVQPSQLNVTEASKAETDIYRRYQVGINPDRIQPSRLPLGQGNRRLGGRYVSVFAKGPSK